MLPVFQNIFISTIEFILYRTNYLRDFFINLDSSSGRGPLDLEGSFGGSSATFGAPDDVARAREVVERFGGLKEYSKEEVCEEDRGFCARLGCSVGSAGICAKIEETWRIRRLG